MTEARKLSLVDTRNCPQYKTEAKLFIEDEHPSGLRQLVVQYEGRPEFAAAIPDDWTETRRAMTPEVDAFLAEVRATLDHPSLLM